jgi:hypothetical protein
VRARILIAGSAWLLGAVTATGGCLMAVSLLGAGFGVSGNSSQQLNNAAVLKGLAATRPQQSPAPSATPSHAARARLVRKHAHAAPPTPSPSPTPTPTPTPAQSSTAAGTPLTSQGGTVVATCESAGAYLLSWSPAPGYAVAQGQVVRGPAAVASVTFDAGSATVTMNVSCSTGTPVSSTSSSPGHDE